MTEYLHVMAPFAALLLSGIAAALAVEHAGDLSDCLRGLGPGADRLQDLVVSLFVNYVVIVSVNGFATVILWLSFFHCDALECALKHMLTSSKTLGYMLAVVWLTFLMQILRIGYVLTLNGVLSSLAYICDLGPGVVYLAQELTYAIGNATATGSGGAYSPHDKQPYGDHAAWSMYLGIGQLVHKLDFMQYCKDTDAGRDDGASSVMYGCFLSLISQALMIMALSGEKARVEVHDLHEEHSWLNMASQFGQQARQQAQHSFEQLPLLGQGMTQQMTQAWQHPEAIAGNVTDRLSGLFPGAAGTAKQSGFARFAPASLRSAALPTTRPLQGPGGAAAPAVAAPPVTQVAQQSLRDATSAAMAGKRPETVIAAAIAPMAGAMASEVARAATAPVPPPRP